MNDGEHMFKIHVTPSDTVTGDTDETTYDWHYHCLLRC